jgi:outer membrane protein insertion porin family
MKIYLLAVILVLTLGAGWSVAADMPTRPKVAEVRFDYPGDLPESLPGLVTVKPGEELSPRAVRESIRLIYLMGMFSDIQVEGTYTDKGLAVTFKLVPKRRVDDIDVEGAHELSDGEVLDAMSLKEGDYLEEKLLAKSKDDIAKLLKDNGLPDGSVEITEKAVDPLRADVIVRLNEGKPARVKDITFEGYLALPEKELKKELEFGVGDILSKPDMDETTENLTALYVDRDYVDASVDLSKTSYSPGEAHVVINIDAGPRLDVTFEGNKSYSDGKLKDLLSFWQDKDVSPENVTANLDRLVEFYQNNGYYYCAITARTEQEKQPPVVSVRFIIVEGPRTKLTRVSFSGNKAINDDDLLAVMGLAESSVLKSRRITDAMVEDDVNRIKALYESKGFLKAEVTPSEIQFSDDGTTAGISFDIKEGPRTSIHSITFTGNSGVTDEELRDIVPKETGAWYNPQSVDDYKNQILNLYSQKGYIHAAVDVQRSFNEDGTAVDLDFKIDEGIPVYIGRVILRGNQDTMDVVILRELLFKPGGVYDYEKILRSQQRIFKLGFMSQVKIQPVNPDKIERKKDLLITVKERDAGAIEFGAGYGEYDLYRGFVETSYSNLWGYGHRVSVRGEMSTKEAKAILSYRWPWFLGIPMDFRSSLVYIDAQKPNYDIRDLIASLGFDKSFGEHLTASLYYQYEKLHLNAPPGAVLLPEDKDKSNLASVSPSLVLDYRDNPFNPTTGSVHALNIKWASSALGSSVDFIKLTLQTSWYFPVYKKIIFAISGRGGFEGWFTSKVEVPISERFFLGGASSLRGFKFETVSPLSADGVPVGGDTMLLFNAELRFPLPYGFGLVTFLDAGNVWLKDRSNVVNGLRYGAGAGIRYDTPVGPLRLDYGFNLDPLPGESRGVLHFTLGQAF